MQGSDEIQRNKVDGVEERRVGYKSQWLVISHKLDEG